MKYLIFIILISCGTSQTIKKKKNPPKKSFHDINLEYLNPQNQKSLEVWQDKENFLDQRMEDLTEKKIRFLEASEKQALHQRPLREMWVKCAKDPSLYPQFKSLLKDWKESAHFWNLVANCAFLNKHYKIALSFWNQSLKITPNNPLVLNNLAVYYMSRANYKKAYDMLQHAATILKNEEHKYKGVMGNVLYINLSRLHLYLGRPYKADQIIRDLKNMDTVKGSTLLTQLEREIKPFQLPQ